MFLKFLANTLRRLLILVKILALAESLYLILLPQKYFKKILLKNVSFLDHHCVVVSKLNNIIFQGVINLTHYSQQWRVEQIN